VNNVLRAMMGALKRWFNWSAPKLTGGSATAYTLTYTIAPGALVDGMSHLVEFHAANGVGATLNLNLLGAIPIYYYGAGAWRAPPPSLIGPNEVLRIAYHGSSGTYRILGRPDTTGDYVPTGRSSARSGTILGYGQAVSRTNYAGLFSAFGTTYGAGDGSTTFNLPNLGGMVVAGKTDMSGSDRGNLSGGTTLGAALGNQTHLQGMTAPNSTLVAGAGADVTLAHYQHTHDISAGSSVQPTIIGNYAICL
jgi:microcystin-dependent protein